MSTLRSRALRRMWAGRIRTHAWHASLCTKPHTVPSGTGDWGVVPHIGVGLGTAVPASRPGLAGTGHLSAHTWCGTGTLVLSITPGLN